jgi:hypothetical protein
VNRALGQSLGLAEDDWVWLSSHHGRIRVPSRLMDGVNRDTVWTWNAIGKHAGAWNLDPASPEFRRGFLLNHLISELLPADGGFDYANADPITGQAAWYDLRVRIDKAPPLEAGESAPSFVPFAHPAGLASPPDILRYGAKGAKSADHSHSVPPSQRQPIPGTARQGRPSGDWLVRLKRWGSKGFGRATGGGDGAAP